MSIPEDQDRAEPGFLADLPLTHPHRERSWLGAIVSLALHLAAVLALLTIAYLSPMTLPGQGDSQRVSLYYNPPPAPPLPLPKGTLNAPKTDPLAVKQEIPKEAFQAPIEVPLPAPMPVNTSSAPQAGSPNGVDGGVPEGAEGGELGGAIGGEPGGVPGGVIGGTGSDPVLDYERGPIPIKITQPRYPQKAFVDRIRGTVVIEILIDARGVVIRHRILQSNPPLDAAAVATVYEWRFSPAIKNGRPVPTLALAPVTFNTL